MLRTALAAAIVAVVAVPAIADTTEGFVHSIDHATGTLVMGDSTVWQLPEAIVLQHLRVGDRVLIDYRSAGEDGLVGYDGLTLLAPALAADEDGGA